MKSERTFAQNTAELLRSIGEGFNRKEVIMEKGERLTPKEFLALPIEERRKLLQEQANDPNIIAYYENILRDERATQDKEMME